MLSTIILGFFSNSIKHMSNAIVLFVTFASDAIKENIVFQAFHFLDHIIVNFHFHFELFYCIVFVSAFFQFFQFSHFYLPLYHPYVPFLKFIFHKTMLQNLGSFSGQEKCILSNLCSFSCLWVNFIAIISLLLKLWTQIQRKRRLTVFFIIRNRHVIYHLLRV